MRKIVKWYARQPWYAKAVVVVVGVSAGVVGGVFAAPAVGAALSSIGIGVAGGTLSGAAASSAGLAALGGGSLATGGLGMAGGTAAVATAAAAVTGSGVAVASSRVAAVGRDMNARSVAADAEISADEITLDGWRDNHDRS